MILRFVITVDDIWIHNGRFLILVLCTKIVCLFEYINMERNAVIMRISWFFTWILYYLRTIKNRQFYIGFYNLESIYRFYISYLLRRCNITYPIGSCVHG